MSEAISFGSQWQLSQFLLAQVEHSSPDEVDVNLEPLFIAHADIFFDILADEQLGHFISSSAFKTSASNWLPQPSQVYS
jgi:hypothetical protein